MKIKNILKNFILSLYISVKRFPISISLATLASILLIILSHSEQNFSSITKDTLGRIAMVLFLGIPLSLIIKFVFERKTTIRGIIKVFVYSIEILILLLYYLFLLKNFEMVSDRHPLFGEFDRLLYIP
jgi:heme/copper-type cytochrome/quinol oxidase subunit 4